MAGKWPALQLPEQVERPSRLGRQGDELPDAIRRRLVQALVQHLGLDRLPRLLVQLVHGGADGAKLRCGAAADLKDGVQDAAVIELDFERADGKIAKDADHDGEHFCICHHDVVRAGDVEVTLIELTVAPSRQLRIVSPVHLRHVEALDVAWSVHGKVPGERHRQIVPQGEDLAALVRKVVDELRVLSVLPSQGFLQLKDGRVNLHGSVHLENPANDSERFLAHAHLRWMEVPRPPRNLGHSATRPRLHAGQALDTLHHRIAAQRPCGCIGRSEDVKQRSTRGNEVLQSR
mmetsp:Transcript_11251/g.41990  ORF Transcript_11251/g.41990 Transcript_11251/m.41990 type:complete len:290 (-) Transcript_11251:1362-2231(-)